MTNIPQDRKYTSSHEWIVLEGDTATIGITDHAQEQLGDLVFVQLPETDATLEQGDEMVTLESVKAAADVYCPISGTVTEINSSLEDDPEQINANPYEAWLVKLQLADGFDSSHLLDADGYSQAIDE